ncbi:MAG: hypothetical protein HY540_00005 [Deltaproteobacteria bacterium]|nr:hypothetical protein [Deltaproteobacteria bacterium]
MAEINFRRAPGQATASEMKAFQKLSTATWVDQIKFEGEADLNNDATKDYFGCPRLSQDGGHFLRCVSGGNFLFKWAFGKKIKELRYGDIDDDGDIDIAVKLENGAIYVFHNLLIQSGG